MKQSIIAFISFANALKNCQGKSLGLTDLILWSRALDCAAISHVLELFPTFCDTWPSSTVFAQTLHLFLLWARSIQSMFLHATFYFNISPHLRLDFPCVPLPWVSRLNFPFSIPFPLLRDTSPTHNLFFGWIILMIRRDIKTQSSPFRNVLNFTVATSFKCINVVASRIFLNSPRWQTIFQNLFILLCLSCVSGKIIVT